MVELLYSSLDLAIIISNWQLSIVKESQFINNVWEEEKEYLLKEYRTNRKKLILDVKFWLNYIEDETKLSSEFPVVNKDLLAIGSEKVYSMEDSFINLDIFFKNLRLRILFFEERSYVRMKLRTLLKEYGYLRRSKQLVDYVNKRLYFYHIQISLRGDDVCGIGEIALDDMVTFRVVGR